MDTVNVMDNIKLWSLRPSGIIRVVKAGSFSILIYTANLHKPNELHIIQVQQINNIKN